MPQKITARYCRISPQTDSGTCIRTRMLSRQTTARTLRTTVSAPMSAKEACTSSMSPCSSRCPKRIENSAPLPIQSPSRMEVRKFISVNAEPTAASASLPRNLPTTHVSAIL